MAAIEPNSEQREWAWEIVDKWNLFHPTNGTLRTAIAYALAAREASQVESVKDLREALSWSLDIMDMYDKRLVELGDPTELVNSELYLKGKAKARAALQTKVGGDA